MTIKLNNLFIPLIVFFSGFCSLVYQVSWERIIKSNLGGDQISSFIVTSSFLIGLGFGAYIFRRRFVNPIKAYAVIEFFIACFAFLSYFVFTSLISYMNEVVLTLEHIAYLRVNTIFLSFLLLIPPCILIGGTLPVLFDSFLIEKNYSSKNIGFIYGLNTLGACVGISSIPIIFFNQINITNTLILVASFNLFISICLFLVHLKQKKESHNHKSDFISNANKTPNVKKINYDLLILAFLSGGIAFLMEIVFFRIAATNWPSSAYNFPLILMIFLFFLGIGSLYFSKIVNNSEDRSKQILSTLFLSSVICIFSTIFIQAFYETTSIVSIVLKYLILVGPFAFFQGGIFPILLRLSSPIKKDLSNNTGIIYLINSIGAFTLVAFSQFILFDLIGIKGVIIFLISLSIVCLLIVYFKNLNSNFNKTKISGAFAILVLTIFISNDVWNVYRFNQNSIDLIGKEGSTGIATISWYDEIQPGGILADVKINGHYMSALPNHPSHVPFELFALSSNRKSNIIILGLGGGGMVRELNNDQNILKIQVVDWSNEISELLLNDRADILLEGALKSNKVNVISGDARQFINLSNSNSIDIIIDNLAYTYMSGATSVKSIEYYEQISRTLHDDAIFILSINGRDVSHAQSVIRSVNMNFKHTYYNNNLLISSNSSLDCFFDNDFAISEERCPLNKLIFNDVFLQHTKELPKYISSLKLEDYINNFIKVNEDEFIDAQLIKDNSPILEYYLF